MRKRDRTIPPSSSTLTPSGMPPHCLNLKINSVVMLRNLSLQQGLCNGTRLKVSHMRNNCIQASILPGANQVLIPHIKLAPSDMNLPFVLERHQLPLRLAYSMTINKAQGQTFEKVVPSPVFSPWPAIRGILKSKVNGSSQI